jgi:hypothetical protein
MVFPGVQDRTWTYDRKAKAYYFHRFYDFQPDLNMDNPHVRAEIRIMGTGWSWGSPGSGWTRSLRDREHVPGQERGSRTSST